MGYFRSRKETRKFGVCIKFSMLSFSRYTDFCLSDLMYICRVMIDDDKENNIDILYGFSINADDKIMDLPGKIVATATSMLENALKSLSLVNYQKP